LGEHRLGNSYWVGEGTPRDVNEARKWLQKAANQGYAPAQADLSLIYLRGNGGTRPDYELACFWSGVALGRLKGEDYRKGAKYVQEQACGKLGRDEARAINKRVGEWKPDEVWRNRQLRELEERRKQWQQRTD
jgi:TPR repeat protein